MDYLNAFLCGGILCAIGQILIDKTPLTPARILTGYVVCGVLLTAIGVYEPIVKWGGAGATVPLLGFGYSLAKGVEKAVQEQGWLGVMTGGLSATAGGIAAAVVFAVLMALIFKPGRQAVIIKNEERVFTLSPFMENRFLRCAQAGLFDLLKRHHSGVADRLPLDLRKERRNADRHVGEHEEREREGVEHLFPRRAADILPLRHGRDRAEHKER